MEIRLLVTQMLEVWKRNKQGYSERQGQTPEKEKPAEREIKMEWKEQTVSGVLMIREPVMVPIPKDATAP